MTGVISVVLLVAGLVIVVCSCAGMAVFDDPLGSDLSPAGLAQSVDPEDQEAECGQHHQELAEWLIAQGQQRLIDAAGLRCLVGDRRVDHQHAG